MASQPQLQTQISTPDAFPPAGPYSQAILLPASASIAPSPTPTKTSTSPPPPRILYISGQIPASPNGDVAPPSTTITHQTSLCMRNILAIITAASSPPPSTPSSSSLPSPSSSAILSALVKVNVFLTNMQDFKEFNEEYGRWMEEVRVKPARSCVEVRALPLGVGVEIEGVALV